MLIIYVPPRVDESWNESTSEFEYHTFKGQKLQMEHSLVSISKWEMKYNKAFLSERSEKTTEEMLYYIKCMTINKNVSDDVYLHLTDANIKSINDYINSRLTATYVNQKKPKEGASRNNVVTSELIYYWMISYNIPFECQKWPLQRLLALINICQAKAEASGKKHGKMSKQALADRRALNAKRKAASHSHG